MISLLPQAVIEELDERFGQEFRAVSNIDRLALATARIENRATNERLREISGAHPSDLTVILRKLVGGGFLERHGPNRGAYYQLPPMLAVGPAIDLFSAVHSPRPAIHAGSAGNLPAGLNPRQVRALEWVDQRGSITRAEYESLVDVTRRTVDRDLSELLDKRLLRRVQRGLYVREISSREAT